jgi:hypothetical protein
LGLINHSFTIGLYHCFIADSNGVALSQKRYPHMCRIQPSIDFALHTLTLSLLGTDTHSNPADNSGVSERSIANTAQPLIIALDDDGDGGNIHTGQSRAVHSSIAAKTLSVCGVACLASFHSYGGADGAAARWLTEALGVPCTLARIAAPVSASTAGAAVATASAPAVASSVVAGAATSEAAFRVTGTCLVSALVLSGC